MQIYNGDSNGDTGGALMAYNKYGYYYDDYDDYVRNKRDVIIWYGISKKEKLNVINSNIKKRGLEPLYMDE